MFICFSFLTANSLTTSTLPSYAEALSAHHAILRGKTVSRNPQEKVRHEILR